MRKQMIRRAFVFALASQVVPDAHVGAQSVGKMVVDDVSNAVRDFGGIWMSPFRGSGKDYLIAASVLGLSAAASPLDDEVDRWAIKNRDRGFLDAIRPFRRGGDLYSLNKATPYVAGLYVVGLATKHRGIRDGIFGCVAAYGANTTIRHQVIYRLVGRDRPDTVRNRPEGFVPIPSKSGDQYGFRIPANGWGDHSFPGGHIATMAVCASFLNHRFDMGVVEPALAGLVLVMGVGRLADQGHWLSDQLVGAAFGYAVGREIARRQTSRLTQERRGVTGSAPDNGSLHIGGDANGARVGWQMTF